MDKMETTSSIDTMTGPTVQAAPLAVGGAILTITPAAAERVRVLLQKKTPTPEAVVISVTNKGCSGHSYDLQYLDRIANKPTGSDVIAAHGVTVVVHPEATMFIIGSTMDYKAGSMRSGFDFTNPNATAQCGCGESFSVG